jgi:AraC-like DNA-binding protein
MTKACHQTNTACYWLNKLSDRLREPKLPGIVCASNMGSALFGITPAELLQIGFVMQGGFPRLHVGKRVVQLMDNEAAICGVHFGHHGKDEPGTSSWGLYFDVKREPLFYPLRKEPLFSSFAVRRPERLRAAFRAVAMRWGSHKAPGFWYYAASEAGGIAPAFPSPRLPSHADVFLRAALFELVAILIEEAESQALTPKYSMGVSKAMDYMTTHYDNAALALADVAPVAGVGAGQLRRLFRKDLGMTPMHFLRGVRLTQGRFLLEQTALRVKEVSANVGFEDPLYFSRIFRGAYGMSPAEYRSKTARRLSDPR